MTKTEDFQRLFTDEQLVALRFIDLEFFIDRNATDIDYGRDVILSIIAVLIDDYRLQTTIPKIIELKRRVVLFLDFIRDHTTDDNIRKLIFSVFDMVGFSFFYSTYGIYYVPKDFDQMAQQLLLEIDVDINEKS